MLQPFSSSCLLVAADCIAQTQGAADEVLLENDSIKLTLADYQVELLRVPPEMRAEFAASPTRLTTLLNQILIDKTLAKQARDAGLDRDPELAARLAHEIDRFYAQAELFKIEQDAGARFDAHASDYLPKAREIYLLDQDKYRTPEQVSASHILFATASMVTRPRWRWHGKRARSSLRAQTSARWHGRSRTTPPRQPTAAHSGGSRRPRWIPPSARLRSRSRYVGDLSEPVLTRFGYHIIRLDGRRPAEVKPFEQVSKKIMADLRQRYVKEARDARVEAIRTDPHAKVNQAAIDALLVKLPEMPKLPGPVAPAIE